MTNEEKRLKANKAQREWKARNPEKVKANRRKQLDREIEMRALYKDLKLRLEAKREVDKRKAESDQS